MNRVVRNLLLALPLLLAGTLAQAEGLERWPFRYILIVEDEGMYEGGRHNAARAKQAGERVPHLEAYVKPRLLVKRPQWGGFAVFLLEFDRAGRLLDPRTRKPTGYIGIVTPYKNGEQGATIKLGRREGGRPVPYVILGFYDSVRKELCDSPDLERMRREAENPPNPYEPVEFYSFWCRDWAGQLRSPKVRVMDVTSDAEGVAYIGEFVGHALFEDKRKPVWGVHGDLAYCLADCPEGRPGRVKWQAPQVVRGRDYGEEDAP